MLTDATSGTWSRTLPATSQQGPIVDMALGTQTTITRSILTIATDRTNIYALVEETSLTIPSSGMMNGETTSQSWGIHRVQLLQDGSANLVTLPNLNPPLFNGQPLVNIIDLDYNTEQDVVVVANTTLEQDTDSNQLYSLKAGNANFNQIPISSFEAGNQTIPPPSAFSLVRFYFLESGNGTSNGSDNVSLIASVDNSINTAYVPAADSNGQPSFTMGQQVRFTGSLEGAFFPKVGFERRFHIPDLAVGEFSNVGSSNLWLNVLGIDNPLTDTSYQVVFAGSEFPMPGYNDTTSRLYVTSNNTYTMASGICQ